jgi:hypothetical protein
VGESLRELVERCEADPAAALDVRVRGDALAAAEPGELALRWHLVLLRAVIADPPDADAVRELYGELVDHYRDDRASLDKLRPLGDEIRRRESAGTLPSVLVARSDRKKR